MKRFERPSKKNVPDEPLGGITEIELPPSNKVWGRDTDKGQLRLVVNMFEMYLAKTEVTDEAELPAHMLMHGERWRQVLETPEMQAALSRYLHSHTQEDIENMRGMEALLLEYRKASDQTLQ